ncbi:MAG: type III pantothenate kinase [Gallionella sp.]|nr:type III pantothenate kinase [Gallionella sp.]
MNLLIDAGNTRIKWALAEAGGDSWLHSGVLPVEQAGELAQFFAGYFSGSGMSSRDIQIWASNVAGAEVARHIRNIGSGCQPRFVVALEAQCGVRNGYANAAQLGSDRWAALIAAWHLVRGECLVVSCGTATTIDALSGHGEFLGGLILPGLELMQRSLCNATAQLQPEQGIYAPFPLNTADALLSGALQASCGAIERQYALLGKACPELGRKAAVPVLLSGGAAASLKSSLNLPIQMMDNPVLQGLLLIAQEAGA